MLEASVFGQAYCRLLTLQLDDALGRDLCARFNYVFAVCYEQCSATGYEQTAKNACMIDLEAGMETVLSTFHATSRNEVRRADKIPGLYFQEAPGSEMAQWYPFYRSCENARNWFPVPESEYDNSLIFIALYNDAPISGMSVYQTGKHLRVGRIFSDKRLRPPGQISNLVYGCAAKRMVYNICRYGVESGCSTLDLGGVDLHDPQKQGITAFKLSMGGVVKPVTLARFAQPEFTALLPKIREAGLDIT